MDRFASKAFAFAIFTLSTSAEQPMRSLFVTSNTHPSSIQEQLEENANRARAMDFLCLRTNFRTSDHVFRVAKIVPVVSLRQSESRTLSLFTTMNTRIATVWDNKRSSRLLRGLLLSLAPTFQFCVVRGLFLLYSDFVPLNDFSLSNCFMQLQIICERQWQSGDPLEI